MPARPAENLVTQYRPLHEGATPLRTAPEKPTTLGPHRYGQLDALTESVNDVHRPLPKARRSE